MEGEGLEFFTQVTFAPVLVIFLMVLSSSKEGIAPELKVRLDVKEGRLMYM